MMNIHQSNQGVNMKNQKETVFSTVVSFYGDKFENGMNHTKDNKGLIVDILLESYDNNEWEVKSSQENMRNYTVGLLNNHLRKDVRLNGGEKYKSKNPGSRTHQKDDQVKNMRLLLKGFDEGSVEHTKIKKILDERIKELSVEKIDVDVNSLPKELRSLVG